ncbi:hypothetical protein ACQHIV_36070 [Kribbella sp. GL6]|uniref:hypothetical protein n=1 Tax=Kribbella sp. GL6 TaxID=3419765 RepID=UPI003D0257B5
MNDLRDLLRLAAAEGNDAVDLAEDAVAERIRRRRIRRRRFAAGGVAIASVATIAGTAWAVLPTGAPSGPAAVADTPRIVTSDSDGLSGMEAAMPTTLTVDANGCVRPGPGKPSVTLVWPRGYTVRGDAKSFEILDSGGHVVTRSGVPITIGGGGADHFQATWTGRDCLAGHLWMVGNIS